MATASVGPDASRRSMYNELGGGTMPPSDQDHNGTIQCLVTVHAAAGQFTAQAVGLPDVRATAATREEAFAKLREILNAVVSSGALTALEVPAEKPLLSSNRWDPNDPEMLA